jgi:predicted DNA-binding transcriptional regulator AlpA
MRKPSAQRSPYEHGSGQRRKPLIPAAGNLRHRQGDRGGDSDDDDDSNMRVLPVYVRFSDLRAAGIVRSWVQLARMVNYEGFPTGILLGPHSRAWTVAEIEAWLATRPPAGRAERTEASTLEGPAAA